MNVPTNSSEEPNFSTQPTRGGRASVVTPRHLLGKAICRGNPLRSNHRRPARLFLYPVDEDLEL